MTKKFFEAEDETINKYNDDNNNDNYDDDSYIDNQDNSDDNDDDNDESNINVVIDNEQSENRKNKNKIDISIIIFDSINDISLCLKNLQNEMKDIQKKMNILKKDYSKLINIKNKLEKKKQKQTNILQSGFIKPRALSPEICDFLKIDRSSLKGRNEVTSLINNYIVENNLRDSNDRRIILPNEELKNLLKIDDTVSLSYFNIQKYLKIHFR